MKSVLDFLVAARRCEIHGLEQLVITCELVGAIARLIHALQKERGASNLFLGSQGRRFGAQRLQHIAECSRTEAAVRGRFDGLDTDSGRLAGGMRLFTRIAGVIHGLDALPALRDQIDRQALTAAQATSAFNALVAGLLAVVFEAADAAADPTVSRALVALFHFMQGKELAGQERAAGALAFAGGRAESAHQERLVQLAEAQQRCLDIVGEFADAGVLAPWRRQKTGAATAELERLRRLLCDALPGTALDPDLSEHWFDCCSARIDAMKAIEDRLAAGLRQVCAHRIADARAELTDQTRLAAAPATGRPGAMTVFVDQPAATAEPGTLAAEGLGPRLGRSLVDIVRAQSQRLQAISDELNAARGALNERKLIERAKGLLMAQRGLTEDQAYRMLRQTAMQQGRRLAEVAAATVAELPPARNGQGGPAR